MPVLLVSRWLQIEHMAYMTLKVQDCIMPPNKRYIEISLNSVFKTILDIHVG